MNKLKQKASSGFIWSAVDRFSVQVIQLTLGLFLARLLTPSDYGIIGMITIFVAISQTIVNRGYGAALVQKKNRDELDFSTIFYSNVLISTLLFLILYIIAPVIANFYNQPVLVSVTRVFSISLIVSSLVTVQRARLIIKLDFKTQTKISLVSSTTSGVFGIFLAYNGFGVWALVWMNLARRFIEVIALWFYTKWLPRKGFSLVRLKLLFGFGSKLLVSGLLDTIFNNIYLVIIGKYFNTASLGYYTRAQQLTSFTSTTPSGVIQRVAFPVMSEMQDDDEKLVHSFRKMIKLSALIIFPLMVGLALLAEPFVRVVLTEKWIESVWMVQFLSFAMMWYPIQVLNLELLKAKGRSDIFLRLEIIKKVLAAVILVISVPFGIKAIIVGQIVLSYIALVINTHYTKKIIDYGFLQQMSDLFKVLLLSMAMGAIIYFLIAHIPNDGLKLIIGFFTGTLFYISLAWLFNIGDIRLLPDFIRQR